MQGEFFFRNNAGAQRRESFSGYLKNEAATEEAWRDRWLRTGDVVLRDAVGMFYFADRKKNIIRRSRENIAAAEVEAYLIAHEAATQAAVIVVPDDLREEKVMACTVPSGTAEAGEALARELSSWCRERMSYSNAPGWFLFVDRLPTGSTQKFVKIKMFAEGGRAHIRRQHIVPATRRRQPPSAPTRTRCRPGTRFRRRVAHLRSPNSRRRAGSA